MSWKDIDINLSKQHDGDIVVRRDIDAIIDSITNIFETMQGSRRMIPEFAMPIYNILFEQIDEITLSDLEDNLLNAISTWEDRIYIEDLKAIPDEDNNLINVKLKFRLLSDLSDKTYNFNKTLVFKG